MLLAVILGALAVGVPSASGWSDPPHTLFDPAPGTLRHGGPTEYATDARGGLMVGAWREADGSIAFQTRDGAWSAREVVRPPGTTNTAPVEVQLSEEAAYLAWEAPEKGGIFVQRKDLESGSWDAPREVFAPGTHGSPFQFAANAGGDMVFWVHDGENDSRVAKTIVRRSIGDGWEEQRIPYLQLDDRFRNVRATAISDAGHIVLAGQHFDDTTPTVYRWARESETPTGQALERNGADAPRTAFNVEVGIDGAGRIFASWMQQRFEPGDPPEEYWYSRVETASGTIEAGFGPVSTLDSAKGSDDPLLRVNERGDAVVAWIDEENDPESTDDFESVQARTRKAGGAWSSIQQITPLRQLDQVEVAPHLLDLDEAGTAVVTFRRLRYESARRSDILEGTVARDGAFRALDEIHRVDWDPFEGPQGRLGPLAAEVVAGTAHVVFHKVIQDPSSADAVEDKLLVSSDEPRPEVTITDGPDGPTADDTPTFEFTSDWPGGATFECRMDGQPAGYETCASPKTYAALPNGEHRFEVRARSGPRLVGPVASREFTVGVNCDSPERGARASKRIDKAILRFGVAEVIGCFERTGPGEYTNGTPGIRLNGIDVAAPSRSLEIDTNAWTIDSGDTVVRFSVGGQKVWAGTLDRKFSSSDMSEAFSKSVEGTAFKGLKLAGSLTLGMVPPTGAHFSGATQLTLVGELPQTGSVKFGSAGAGALQFVARTANDTGLQLPTITGTLGEVQIGKFGARNLQFAYNFASDAWTAGVDIVLPFPHSPLVGGSVTVTKGKVTAFTARTDGLQAPVGTGIFLQRLNVGASTGDDGATFTVTGGAGLSVGPRIPLPDGDVEAISGDGTVSYAFSDPGVWSLAAALKMVNVPLADGLLTVTTAGKADFEGRAHLHGQVGRLDLFNAEGKLFGFADRDVSWQAQGALHHVEFLNWSFGDDANAQALASSEGIAVCVGGAGHRVGFSYDYRAYHAMDEGCDVGEMAVVRGRPVGRSHTRAAAGDRARVSIGEGETLAVFAGKAADRPPRLSVTGPGGTAITTPESGVAQTDTHLVGHDAEGRTYVVVFDPPAGRYDISSDRPLEELAAADSTGGGNRPLEPVIVEPDPDQLEPSPGAPSPGAPDPVRPGPDAPPVSGATLSGVTIKRDKLRTALRRGVRLTGSSSAPATLTASLFVTAKAARKLKLGRRRMVLASGRTRVSAGRFTLRLRVDRSLARSLRRVRKLPLSVSGTATTAAGARTPFTARRVLRR